PLGCEPRRRDRPGHGCGLAAGQALEALADPGDLRRDVAAGGLHAQLQRGEVGPRLHDILFERLDVLPARSARSRGPGRGPGEPMGRPQCGGELDRIAVTNWLAFGGLGAPHSAVTATVRARITASHAQVPVLHRRRGRKLAGTAAPYDFAALDQIMTIGDADE